MARGTRQKATAGKKILEIVFVLCIHNQAFLGLVSSSTAIHNRNECYSAILLLRIASCSFLMSSGDNCGRSTFNVILLNLPVKGNGH
jgi:hypothetical protein